MRFFGKTFYELSFVLNWHKFGHYQDQQMEKLHSVWYNVLEVHWDGVQSLIEAWTGLSTSLIQTTFLQVFYYIPEFILNQLFLSINKKGIKNMSGSPLAVLSPRIILLRYLQT